MIAFTFTMHGCVDCQTPYGSFDTDYTNIWDNADAIPPTFKIAKGAGQCDQLKTALKHLETGKDFCCNQNCGIVDKNCETATYFSTTDEKLKQLTARVIADWIVADTNYPSLYEICSASDLTDPCA